MMIKKFRFKIISLVSGALIFAAQSISSMEEVDLKKLEESIEKMRIYANQHKDPQNHVLIVIGKRGSGKSALINYLAEKPLMTQKDGNGRKFLDTNNPLDGFNICHAANSEIKLISVWHDAKNNITYQECPFDAPTGSAARDY